MKQMMKRRLPWAEALVCLLAVGCGGPEMELEEQQPGEQHGITSPAETPEQELSQEIIHRPPEVPMTLDGVAAAPESVTRYNGQPLYYIPSPDGKQLNVFTTKARLQAFMNDNLQAYGVKQAESVSSLAYNGLVYIYEHDNFGGGSHIFGQQSHYGSGDGALEPDDDLRTIGCFLFFCGDWNDKISSIRVQSGPTYTVLHEHIRFQGSMLVLVTNNDYWRLSPYGWNDRASSISYSWTAADPVYPE
jgi:hypothetical protein